MSLISNQISDFNEVYKKQNANQYKVYKQLLYVLSIIKNVKQCNNSDMWITSSPDNQRHETRVLSYYHALHCFL